MKQQTHEHVSTAKGYEKKFLGGTEPLQVKFRYGEIRAAVQKRNCSSSSIETIFRTAKDEECIIKNMSVIGCEVLVWFSKQCDPKVWLAPRGYTAKINITSLIKDTLFYEQLCNSRKLA